MFTTNRNCPSVTMVGIRHSQLYLRYG